MNIINNDMLNLHALREAIEKPMLYKKSTHLFWDDEHISGQMLEFHLNPDVEAASKKAETIEAEVAFIIKETGMNNSKVVLDLGCGPGLYVRKFAETGAKVTGLDMSDRSLAYAEANIKSLHCNVCLLKMNYLELNITNTFDIATLIFYDFCALNTDEQKLLLNNVHNALKQNGVFILDVITDKRKLEEKTTVSIKDGGFWSPESYMEIYISFIYTEPLVEGNQYTIINEEGDIKIIRIYHRLFNIDELTKLLEDSGFIVDKIFNNLKGDPLTANTDTLGIIARKV